MPIVTLKFNNQSNNSTDNIQSISCNNTVTICLLNNLETSAILTTPNVYKSSASNLFKYFQLYIHSLLKSRKIQTFFLITFKPHFTLTSEYFKLETPNQSNTNI